MLSLSIHVCKHLIIMSSTLEDEELEQFDPKLLEVSCVKLEPWLEDEATISK